MVFLGARGEFFDEQYDRFSSEDEENDIKDDGENDIEDYKEDIMSGLGRASKKLAEGLSDSDSKPYEFQEEQKQIKVAQKEEDFTINTRISLNGLNPQKWTWMVG